MPSYDAPLPIHQFPMLISNLGSFTSAVRSFWHTMVSNDRHASHDSPYRTGQHMPLNQSRHAPLTSVATSALESRADLNSTYGDDTSGQFTPGFQNGNVPAPGTPGAGPMTSPTSPYLPGMRTTQALQKTMSSERNPFDSITPGEIQMQSFQEGLPPPPPVAHSWKKIGRWAEDNYEELFDQLSEGATQNDVNELEHELDCSLPIEVRESLQVHDGQERGGRPTGIIFGCMLLDCEEIVQEWKNWRVVNEEYLTTPPNPHPQYPPKAFGGASSSSSAAPISQSSTNPLWRQDLLDRQDSQPPRAIQKAYAHPGWIPLARDWGGNNLAVDLAPGPVGKWGQIIIFGRDYDCKYVVARSWSAFLATVADDMSGEKVFVEEETGDLKLKEFKTTNVEPAYLDILRWRMDQKYGRKGPRRRPISTPPNGRSGSPYGSPTEERGRSPQRFPMRGPTVTQSPRGGAIGKPSPLAQVSEENLMTRVHTGGDANQDAFAKNTAASERDGNLVELSTPAGVNDGYKQEPIGKVMEADIPGAINDAAKMESHAKPLSGLGVDGMGEMKSVEI